MKVPLTLRLIYHGVRAALFAGVLLVVGWIALVPATQQERATLGATDRTAFPAGLREMRAAKVVIAIAPDGAYDLAARAIGPGANGLFVKLIIMQVADGQLSPAQMGDPHQGRAIEGPRFVQVD